MHDFYYTRLLDDPAKFEPRSGNRCVEVFDQTVGDHFKLLSELAYSSIGRPASETRRVWNCRIQDQALDRR